MCELEGVLALEYVCVSMVECVVYMIHSNAHDGHINKFIIPSSSTQIGGVALYTTMHTHCHVPSSQVSRRFL